ncbi:MAG: ferredoxin [Candidatus Magasanikbacteria bacterium]
MAIKIDKEKCISCGVCAALCGNVFKLDEDNKAQVYNESGDTVENVKSATDACPVAAITLE